MLVPLESSSAVHVMISSKSVSICIHFYVPQQYRQVLLRARISYRNSVRLSVCPSRPGTDSRPGEIETPDLHHMIESLVSNEVILVPLGEEIPLEWGHQRGVPPLEIIILRLLAHLAWKRLQIDTDLVLTITSTADELSGGASIDDADQPWTPKIGGFSEFFAILGCDAHFCWNILEIDQDNLRTKLNWCCRTSHEH